MVSNNIISFFFLFFSHRFYEVEVFKSSVEYGLNPILGPKFVSRLFKVLKFAIKALSALGNEMFRLTNATRGGMLLMMVFFYSAFVLGVSLWIETDGENPECLSFPQCSYNLMRLTFYDGTGFDLAYSLTTKHRFLFFLLMVYMCLTSFGILNGLVGIFGTAFAVASDEAFNDTDNEDEDDEGDIQDNDDNNNEYNKYSSYRDLLPKNNYDDDPNNGDNDSSGDEIGGGGGTEVYRRSSIDHTNNNNNNMDDPMNMIFQRGQSRSRLETKQLEQKLKGKLGGKSNFALKELTKLASAETHAQQEYAQQHQQQ